MESRRELARSPVDALDRDRRKVPTTTRSTSSSSSSRESSITEATLSSSHKRARQIWFDQFLQAVADDTLGSKFPVRTFGPETQPSDIWKSFDTNPFHDIANLEQCAITAVQVGWRDVLGEIESDTPTRDEFSQFVAEFRRAASTNAGTTRITETHGYQMWDLARKTGLRLGHFEYVFHDRPLFHERRKRKAQEAEMNEAGIIEDDANETDAKEAEAETNEADAKEAETNEAKTNDTVANDADANEADINEAKTSDAEIPVYGDVKKARTQLVQPGSAKLRPEPDMNAFVQSHIGPSQWETARVSFDMKIREDCDSRKFPAPDKSDRIYFGEHDRHKAPTTCILSNSYPSPFMDLSSGISYNTTEQYIQHKRAQVISNIKAGPNQKGIALLEGKIIGDYKRYKLKMPTHDTIADQMLTTSSRSIMRDLLGCFQQESNSFGVICDREEQGWVYDGVGMKVSQNTTIAMQLTRWTGNRCLWECMATKEESNEQLEDMDPSDGMNHTGNALMRTRDEIRNSKLMMRQATGIQAEQALMTRAASNNLKYKKTFYVPPGAGAIAWAPDLLEQEAVGKTKKQRETKRSARKGKYGFSGHLEDIRQRKAATMLQELSRARVERALRAESPN